MTWKIVYGGGGVEVDLSDLGDVALLEHDGAGMPPTEVQLQQRGELDGALYQGMRMRERTLALAIWAKGETEAEYWTQRDLLMRIFRPMGAAFVLQKTLPSGRKREITCYPAGGLTLPSKGSKKNWSTRDVVRLVCPDPLWTDPDAYTSGPNYQEVSHLTPGFSVPPAPDGYPGSADSMAWKVRFTAINQWVDPGLNNTDGDGFLYQIQLTGYTLGVGHWMEFDFEAQTIVDDAGTNLVQYLADGHDFAIFALFASRIAYPNDSQGLDTDGTGSWRADVTVTYYAKYLGV